MKKTLVTRLLAILVCMAMLATVTPIFAAAETTITEIEITDVDTVPYIGENASDYLAYTLPEDCHYSMDYFYWYDEESGDHLPGDADTFEAGKEYSRRWNLVADEGYTFGDRVTVTINGVFSLVDTLYTEMGDHDTEYVVWMKPTAAKEKPATVEIKRIDITDVDLLPLVGDKTNDHIGYTFPENCHFTAENHFWYDHTTRAWKDGADDVFEDGHSYRVGWWLYADEGYSFAEFPTITINGGEDIYWSSTYIDEDSSKRFFVWTNPMDAVEPTVIDKIEIDGFCDAVVGGKAGDFIHLTLPEDAPYHFDGDPWWVEDAEDLALSDDDIFEAGKEYTLGGWLIADKGYIFAENPEVLLNGGDYPVDEKWTERDDTDAGEFHVWSEPREAVELIAIDKIDITDVSAVPYIGGKAENYLYYTLPENCHYSMETNLWYNEDTGNYLPGAETAFASGNTYSHVWNLVAEEGYTFAENATVTVNESSALVDTTWTKRSDDGTMFEVWTLSSLAIAPTVIDKIEIDGFCDPVVGGKAGDFNHLTLPEDAPYQFFTNFPLWGNVTDDVLLDNSDTFEKGKSYSLGGWLVVNNGGYIFAEDAEVLLNGGEYPVDETNTERDESLNYGGYVFYVWSEPTEAVEPIVIDKIEIIDADVTPILGEKTGDWLDYTLSDDCHFTVDRHYWYNEDTGNRMESAAVFEAGPQYDGFWYIQADSGYTFSAETVVTINGTTDLVDATWTEINDEDSTGFYVWTNPTEAVEPIVIDKIEIDGFCDPVAGGKAGDYLNLTLPEDAPYHFGEGSPRWYNDTDGKVVYDDDTFEAGQFYSLGGMLVADAGYIFAEKPEIVLNGGEVSVLEADSYRNDEDASIFYAWGESKEAVEAPAALLGDANDDGAVNMKDVLVLRKQLGGMNPTINMTNADCNEDGTVNMKDVLLLRKYLASMVEKLGA